MKHKLTYVPGDLFDGIKTVDNPILIPHVVNNIGKWGAGFTKPLTAHFPNAKSDYIEVYRSFNPRKYGGGLILGRNIYTDIKPFGETDLYVVSMIAQNGVGTDSRKLRYSSLVDCMKMVSNQFGIDPKLKREPRYEIPRYEIHCPKFGSGLSGGNWPFIVELIDELWLDFFDVYVYTGV